MTYTDRSCGPQPAGLAALLADETRACMCLALLDGRAWTAGELARHAGVAPSAASEQLTRLVEGGLLAQERQGRHRYVRLADFRTAQLIEDLAAHAAPAPAPHTLRAASAAGAMARARTCYDHLAGLLGTAVTDTLPDTYSPVPPARWRGRPRTGAQPATRPRRTTLAGAARTRTSCRGSLS